MGKLTKKLKRSIVMLLVCALTVGSVPMNTYAAENDGPYKVTVEADEAAVDVIVDGVSENTVSMNDDGTAYNVVSGNTGLTVKVTEKVGYDVTSVGYSVNGGKTEPATKTEVADVYTIPTIKDNTKIVVDTKAEEYPVTVSANNATVEVSETATYGKDLRFTVKAEEDKYEVKEVKYVMGGKTEELDPGTGTFAIPKVTGPVEIYVNAEAKVVTYPVTVSANNATVTVSENAVKGEVLGFTVSVEDNFEVTEVKYEMGGDTVVFEPKTGEFVTEAVTGPVTIYATAVEKTIIDEPGDDKEDTFSIEVVAENAKVTFSANVSDNKVPAGEAMEYTVTPDNGYDVTSVRYIMGGRAVREAAQAGTFAIPAVTADVRIEVETAKEVKIDKVAVTGVKSGKVSQTAYTQKEYAVKFTPANAFDVKVETTGNIEAWLSGSKLVVKTAAVPGENVSDNTVTLKDSTGAVIKDGEFTVNVQAPKFLDGKSTPSVKVKSTTNASVMLTLGSKGLVDKDTYAPVSYKVTLTPVDNDKVGVVEKTIVRTGDSQDAKIYLEDAKGNQLVEGKVEEAIKYTVKVELEQNGVTGKAKEGVTAKTQLPAYETKLKLKKGKTTIIAGEGEVTVATATFSKGTTFRNVRVPDYYDFIDVKYDPDTETIRVTVDKYAPADKYTIYAYSEVPVDENGNELMVPSEAKIDITVVGGIDDIDVDAPVSIYQKEGKKASFNVTYKAYDEFMDWGYDEDGNWVEQLFNTELKKSKVTYSVVDAYGDADTELNKYVTVNNKGKVTISSDFDVSGNNGFMIRVDANDYAGNDVYAESGIINVTDEVTKVGEVVIVRDGKIIAKNNEEVTIDEIRGASVRALKDGVSANGTVSANDFLAENAVSLKVSNKNFVLNGNKVVELKKAVKNLKITATMRDGSGSKNTLVLKNVFGYLGDLQLVASYQDANDMYSYHSISFNAVSGQENKFEGSYKGVQRTLLNVMVLDGEGKPLDGRAASFTMKPNNATTITKGSTRLELEPKGKEVVVKLSYKEKINGEFEKVEKTYTLKNDSLGDATKITSKIKVEGNFVENVYGTVKVKLPEDFNGKFVKISPDWAKYRKDNKYSAFANQISYENIFDENDRYVDTVEKVYQVSDNTIEVSACPWYKGNYKMYLQVGTYEDGVFDPITLEKDVTFKVVALTKVKLATSYTLYLSDGDTVALKSTSKTPISEVYRIYNANVKGQSSDFLSVFDVSEDNLTLTYKGDLEQKTYTAIVEYWDGFDYKYAQIKVNVKLGSAGKLTAPNVTVVDTVEGVLVPVTKTIAKTTVDKYSIVGIKAKNVEVGSDNDMITVAAGQLPKAGKTLKVDAKVVGSDSYTGIQVAVSDNSLVDTYGQNVKFNIKVVDAAAAKKASKIKVSNVAFTEDDYNSVVDSYVVVGEYDELIVGVSANSATSTKGDVKVALVDGTLTYEVDKDTLETKNLYGRTQKINVEFDFGAYGKQEVKNIKVTFPKKSDTRNINLEVKGNASVSVNGTTVSDNAVIPVYADKFSFEVVADAGYEVEGLTVSTNDVTLVADEWNGIYTVNVVDVEDDATVVIDIATKEAEVVVPEEPTPEKPVEGVATVSFNSVSANLISVSYNGVSVSANGTSVSVNTLDGKVTFTVSANEGFKVESVTVGDDVYENDNNGIFTVLVENGSNIIINVVEKVTTLLSRLFSLFKF